MSMRRVRVHDNLVLPTVSHVCGCVTSRHDETEKEGSRHAHTHRNVVGSSSVALARRGRGRRASSAGGRTGCRRGGGGVSRTKGLDLKWRRSVDLHDTRPFESDIGVKKKGEYVRQRCFGCW